VRSAIQPEPGSQPQYVMRKFPMKVILLPSGSVMADNCTPLFTVSTAPAAIPRAERSAIQVAHREVQQGRAGPLGVEGYLHPPAVGHPPLDETLHRQVVGGTAEETLVPRAGSVKVGHRDDGEYMIYGHCLFLQGRDGSFAAGRPVRHQAGPSALRGGPP